MKPAHIRCSKCGYQSNIISDTCIKCGAPLVKICGNCEAVNSVEKNYCDGCGALLALKLPEEKQPDNKPEKPSEKKDNVGEPPRIKIEFESIHETVSAHAESFRKKQEANPQNQTQKMENKDERVAAAEKEKNKLAEFEKKKLEAAKSVSKNTQDSGKKISNYLFIFAAFAAVLIISWLAIAPRIPKIKLVMTAKNYLGALKDKNYSQAYSYLSNNSKFTCSFTDFVKYNDAYYSKLKEGWDFKDVKVFFIKGEGAVVRYSLKEGTGPWKDDYISFVREHDKWVRPYVWHLFVPIDEAIEKGDFSQALFLAQKLYLTDPVDPRTSGYLCNTEYLMGLYDKSAESCRRTLDGQKNFPVGFSKEEIFWFTFYYADSLRFLARFDDSLSVYEELFSFEDISLKNKCPLLMSRADVYVRKKEYEKAASDISAAAGVCPEGLNKKEALRRLSFINGSAVSEAVQAAQKARPSADGQTLFELRNSQLNALNGKNKKDSQFKDEWKAVRIDGPEYEVSVIQEKLDRKGRKAEETEVYRVGVNLWTGSVKMISR